MRNGVLSPPLSVRVPAGACGPFAILTRAREWLTVSIMTASEIISEIEALPPDEQVFVVRFAWRLGYRRRLSPAELGDLANLYAVASDGEDAAVLREEIMQGFYGRESHA